MNYKGIEKRIKMRWLMMSEDIHKWTDGKYTLMFDEHTFFVWDNEKDERMTALNVTKKLNEQQATISQLKQEINEWKKENRELLDLIYSLQLRVVDDE